MLYVGDPLNALNAFLSAKYGYLCALQQTLDKKRKNRKDENVEQMDSVYFNVILASVVDWLNLRLSDASIVLEGEASLSLVPIN